MGHKDKHCMTLAIVSVIFACLVVSYSIFLILPNSLLIQLTEEDGFFETIGALFFLGASIVAFLLFFKAEHGNDFIFFKTNRNVFFAFLGLLFLFAFGEEISWGQRIFSIPTPQVLNEINTQREINFHNLSLFRIVSMNRLFSLFWFVYCVLFPLVNRVSGRFAKVVARINLPILSIHMGMLFLANYLIPRILHAYIPIEVQNSLIEVKEFNLGLLFVVAFSHIMYVYQRNRRHKRLRNSPVRGNCNLPRVSDRSVPRSMQRKEDT